MSEIKNPLFAVLFGMLAVLAVQNPNLYTAPAQPAAAVLALSQTTLADDYGTGVTAVGMYCPKLTTTVQKGARGTEVSELQAFLTSYYNLDENIVVGGYFGNLTQKYVVQFQKEKGLPSLGIAGSLTRAAIAKVCVPGTTTVTTTATTTQTTNPNTNSSAPTLAVMSVSFPNVYVAYTNMPPAGVQFISSTHNNASMWTQELTQGSQKDTTTKTSGTRMITLPSYIPSGNYILQAFGPNNTIYAASQSVYIGAKVATSTDASKSTLQLIYKGKQLSAVATTKPVAQLMCGMLMDWQANTYVTGSSCVWNGQSISYAGGFKDGDARLMTFIHPVSGKNETINKNSGSSYTITLTDPGATSSNMPGKYRLYLAKFVPSVSNGIPETIYEANLTNVTQDGKTISMKWDFGVDGIKPGGVPAGSYYFNAYNTETGGWANVSAYTFIVDNTSVPPTGTATTTTPVTTATSTQPTMADWVGGCANPPVYTGPNAYVGQPYTYDPGVYNAGAPYPPLPSGLTKNNGIITGTPKVAGPVSVKVYSNNSCGAFKINFTVL